MGNVAHVLSPGMVDALATHFKDLDPPPYGGAPRDLMSEEEKIYHEGVPSTEVPAFVPRPGRPWDGSVSALAGQLDGYLIAKLVNWPKERGKTQESRQFGDHGAGRRKADQRADRRGRRLCPRPQVILRRSGFDTFAFEPVAAAFLTDLRGCSRRRFSVPARLDDARPGSIGGGPRGRTSRLPPPLAFA